MEFNSLPLEVHLEIFSYLPVRKVMEIRRVCKQWNRLIDAEFRFKRLRCCQSKYLSSYDFNFISTRSFLDYLNAEPNKFSRVKYLDASLKLNNAKPEDAFDFLNWFRSVEELTFTCYLYAFSRRDRREIEKKTFVLSLKRLKKAKIWLYLEALDSKYSVLLDLPSLLHLQINSWKDVTLKQPEKLKTLATNGLFEGGPDYSKFASLSNIYTGQKDLRSISARFIESLPSLKELHLDHGFCSFRLSAAPSSKTTARIFYFGFEICLNQINSEDQQFPSNFYGPDEATTEFIVGNLHQSLDNNSFIEGIHFNPIARALDDTGLFMVVPQKFPKISHIRINGAVADANRLLKFINHLSISSLAFEGTPLPQWFFEKLTVNGLSIRSLRFHTEPTMDILSGGLDFVFKLNNIEYFTIYPCLLPLNFVARLLRELKWIRNLCFRQPGTYYFRVSKRRQMWEVALIVYGVDDEDNIARDLRFFGRFSDEEVRKLMTTLASRLKADESVCPRKLFVLLRLHQLQLEEETARFMMRKYIYDHTYSICLSEQQMRLFNLRR